MVRPWSTVCDAPRHNSVHAQVTIGCLGRWYIIEFGISVCLCISLCALSVYLCAMCAVYDYIHYRWYHVICWGVSLIMACIPIKQYGPAGAWW